MSRVTGICCAFTVFVMAMTASPSRGAVAYSWPVAEAGAQAFSGSIGMDFVVNTPIDVTSLGVFDHLGDGIAGTLTTTIWDITTGLAVPGASTTFTAGDSGALTGSTRMKSIPTVTLAPGNYSVASSGHGNPDFDLNPAISTVTDDGGGAITITTGRRFRADGSGNFPATIDANGFYGGGTFEFDLPAPPPPAEFDGATVAYQVNAPQAGIQDFGGALGMDFVVTEPIVVSSLGAFDADQNGMARDITVQIWERNDGGTPGIPGDDTGGVLLASEVFTSNDPGTLVGGSRFKSLDSDLVLGPGAYTVSASGYGLGELLANAGFGGGFPIDRQLNDGGGLLEFVGTSRFGVAAGNFPGSPDGGPADRYAAGTFGFRPASVIPEPGVSILMLLGMAGFVGWRR